MKIFLNIVTTICVITIFTIGIDLLLPKFSHYTNENRTDPGRNEESTPRSFVLPSTPAVAKEQERKQQLIKEHDAIMKCIINLDSKKSTKLSGLKDIFDIRIIIGTIEYQKENHLEVTGVFDAKTKQNLGCS